MAPARPLTGLLLAAALAAADPDRPDPVVGVDVTPAIRAAAGLVGPRAAGPAWADDLALLTAPPGGEQAGAIARLIRVGEPVLPDLAVLGRDRVPAVRLRVARVAGGIGGAAAAPLLLRLSADDDLQVRIIATLGLGRAEGEASYAALLTLLASPEPDLRVAAAQALAGRGSARALTALARHPLDGDGVVRREMAAALARLCASPAGVAEALRLLAPDGLRHDALHALLQALAGVADPRLCPALAAHLAPARDQLASLLAVRALAASGDARCWGALAAIAAGTAHDEIRAAAAGTLAVLTGYRARPGEAWNLWWRDHRAEAERLAARDALLARVHDPAAAPDAGALAAFAADDLLPLAEAVLGAGQRPVAPWLPARAWAWISADRAERWCDLLARRLGPETDPELRVGLVVLIDELGGPAARDALAGARERLAALDKEEAERADKSGKAAPRRGAERLALGTAK